MAVIPQLPGAVPEIPVSDVVAAPEYYRDKLGFTIDWGEVDIALAILLSEPESKPWGLHEFTAADPDGNRFRVFYDFATPERESA